jgi:hypothetical protein
MQLFNEAMRREGVQGFRLLSCLKEDRVDTDHPRPGIRVRADSWLRFTSKYNCELWTRDGGNARLETEIDIIALASHGRRKTLYLLDATTSPRIPLEKLHKHKLIAAHLEPDPNRAVETIVVNFAEEKFAERSEAPNVRVLTLPLRGAVAQLQKVSLEALIKNDEFVQVAKRMRDQMG